MSDVPAVIQPLDYHMLPFFARLSFDILIYLIPFLDKETLLSYILTCRDLHSPGIQFLLNNYQPLDTHLSSYFLCLSVDFPARLKFVHFISLCDNYIECTRFYSDTMKQIIPHLSSLKWLMYRGSSYPDLFGYIISASPNFQNLRRLHVTGGIRLVQCLLHSLRCPLTDIQIWTVPDETSENLFPSLAPFAGTLEILDVADSLLQHSTVQFPKVQDLTLTECTIHARGVQESFPGLRIIQIVSHDGQIFLPAVSDTGIARVWPDLRHYCGRPDDYVLLQIDSGLIDLSLRVIDTDNAFLPDILRRTAPTLANLEVNFDDPVTLPNIRSVVFQSLRPSRDDECRHIKCFAMEFEMAINPQSRAVVAYFRRFANLFSEMCSTLQNSMLDLCVSDMCLDKSVAMYEDEEDEDEDMDVDNRDEEGGTNQANIVEDDLSMPPRFTSMEKLSRYKPRLFQRAAHKLLSTVSTLEIVHMKEESNFPFEGYWRRDTNGRVVECSLQEYAKFEQKVRQDIREMKQRAYIK